MTPLLRTLVPGVYTPTEDVLRRACKGPLARKQLVPNAEMSELVKEL